MDEATRIIPLTNGGFIEPSDEPYTVIGGIRDDGVGWAYGVPEPASSCLRAVLEISGQHRIEPWVVATVGRELAQRLLAKADSPAAIRDAVREWAELPE